jgi:hypothetical protein
VRTHSWLRALFFSAVSSLGLCALSGVTAHAEDAAAAPAPDTVDKAQSLFRKGAALYETKRYTLALKQFRASYATVASPNSRLYVARCLAEMGQFVEAYLEFDATAEEAAARASAEPRYVKTQRTAQAERDELARKLGLVTVTVSHPDAASSLEIAGEQVPRERWDRPFPVKAGRSEVVLRTQRGGPLTQTITLDAGEAKSLSLDAAPSRASTAQSKTPVDEHEPADAAPAPGPSRAHLRPYAYAAAAVGVAGFTAFTVGGLMANSTYSDLSSSCIGPCPESRKDDVDAGKTEQLVANVGLAVGAVGLAVGTTLLILSFSGGSSDVHGAATSTHVIVGPGFAGARGTF